MQRNWLCGDMISELMENKWIRFYILYLIESNLLVSFPFRMKRKNLVHLCT